MDREAAGRDETDRFPGSGDETDLGDRDEFRHRDKFSDPRVRVTTGRLLLYGLALTLLATIVALASVAARRTSLTRTSEFFGPDTITALQLADRVELLPGEGQSFEPVDLSGTPGLGHLRRALLDDRHYVWETSQKGAVDEDGEGFWGDDGDWGGEVVWVDEGVGAEGPVRDHGPDQGPSEEAFRVRLRFADPIGKRVPVIELALELEQGWVSLADESRRVRLNARVRPAVRHQLKMMSNVRQQRFDQRAKDAAPG